jgi:hypothetical protein
MKSVLIAMVLAAGVAVGGGSQPQPDMSKVSKKDMLAMIENGSAPAAEHALLEPFVGTSDLTVKMNLAPGVPPLSIKSVTTGEWVLGKRFVQMKTVAAPDEELKTESMSYMGYDTRTKKFFLWGIDTLGTYSIFAEGGYDKESKAFTLLGENEEPGMGKLPFRFTMKAGEGSVTTNLHFQMKGAPGADPEGWFQVMESVATRRKP